MLTLAIDDSGESWIASGRPVVGDGAYVKICYALQGEPHEVELPFVIQSAAPSRAAPNAPPDRAGTWRRQHAGP